jgi:pyruvate dehydrogenase E2 component (dihydrolipoamide acetyltransferase)
MTHRRADLRAAMSRRQRGQGHLRAVTATVGVAGVVTAGAVATILPGSAHAVASPRASSTPAPPAPASAGSSPAASAATGGASGTPAARHHHHHRHHRHASAPAGVPTPAETAAPAAPVPAPAATSAPPQSVSGGS